jgi:hypothetical protein
MENLQDKTEEEENGERWRKAEVTAALVHLYYMRGQSFDPNNFPRNFIAETLGISRFTASRAITDAKQGLDLAVELGKRLQEYDIQEAKRIAERDARRRIAKDKRNQRARERRKAKVQRDPATKKSRERRYGSALRQLQEAAAGARRKPGGRAGGLAG